MAPCRVRHVRRGPDRRIRYASASGGAREGAAQGARHGASGRRRRRQARAGARGGPRGAEPGAERAGAQPAAPLHHRRRLPRPKDHDARHLPAADDVTRKTPRAHFSQTPGHPSPELRAAAASMDAVRGEVVPHGPLDRTKTAMDAGAEDGTAAL
eukprot:4818872-Prymnesium_polylepis.1